MSVLKRIYFRLPGVRQLCQIREHLALLRQELALARVAQHIEAEDRLRAHPRYGDPLRLHAAGFRTFSQHQEDGMIAEIFRRIGTVQKTFVEVGTGDGAENNTRYLLATGWSGWWFEGDAASAATIRRSFSAELAAGRLRFQEGLLEPATVSQAFAASQVPTEPDLLSIDVDQLTYHLLAGLPTLRPRVLVVEYNASFRPPVDWVASAAQSTWDGSVNFGASLVAFDRLASERGYALVGCDLTGLNAFFVRADLAGEKFRQPYDVATHYEPPRYGLGGHPPQPRDASLGVPLY